MIKMIAGVYGLPVKNADGTIRVVGMGPDSGAFSIDEKREAELVASKKAVYVTETADENKQTDAKGTSKTLESSSDDGDTSDIPEYSVDMKATELRKIGAEQGLTFKVGMSKAEMVEALDAHFATETAEDDIEDAPTFDAEDAVL